MKKTTTFSGNKDDKLTVTILGLQELTGLGRSSAEKIAREAKAEIRVGRRHLYNVEKVKNYLYSISE